MAYRKDKHQVLAGGLNLVPPGDQLGVESLQVENWRSDKAGQLQSRKGCAGLTSGIAGPIHSMFREGNDFYAGASTSLKRGLSLATNVDSGFDGFPIGFAAYKQYIYAMNRSKQVKLFDGGAYAWTPAAPAAAPVAAVVDGTIVIVADFEPSETWQLSRYIDDVAQDASLIDSLVENSGTVTVANGSPNVSCTEAAWSGVVPGEDIKITGTRGGAPYTLRTTIASLPGTDADLVMDADWDGDDASGLFYQITVPANPQASDPVHKTHGSDSLFVGLQGAQRWRLEQSFGSPVDGRVDGEAALDDKFFLDVRMNDPTRVTKFRIILQSDAGASECILPDGYFTSAPDVWFTLSIFRASLERQQKAAEANGDSALAAQLDQLQVDIRAGLKTAPLVFGPSGGTDDVDWSAINTMAIEIEITTALNINFDYARLKGGSHGPLDGDVTYFVTYDTFFAHAHESNPSDQSNTVSVAKQKVQLSGISVSLDPQVETKHIYRIGGGLVEPLRIGTIPNATTTFEDTVPNTDPLNSPISMPTDHDPAPPARGMLGPYLGRLIAWSSEDHPSRLWWTPVAQPWYFPGSDDETEGNWIDLGGADDLFHCTNHKSRLFLYKQRSIWIQNGDPDGPDPIISNAKDGAVSAAAIASDGDHDYYVGTQGVYRFNGDFEVSISSKIDPIFKDEFAIVADNLQVAPIARDHIDQCILARYGGSLFFSYPEPGHTIPSCTLRYDIATDRWFHHRFASSFANGGFTALYHSGFFDGFYGAVQLAGGAALFQMEAGTTDAGTAIRLLWQSGYYDQGLPDNPKIYSDLVIEHSTGGPGEGGSSSLVVKLVFDDGTLLTVGTLNSSTNKFDRFALNNGLGVKARNFALRIEGDATTTCTIRSVFMHWYAEERNGHSFDSGVIDLGTQLAKRMDKLEIESTRSAQLNYNVHSDLPDGVIANRLGANLGATSLGRRVEEVDFTPSVVEGYRHRAVMFSASDFQLHRLRARILPIGLYLRPNQVWTSELIPLSGRLSELKDFFLEYAADAAAQMQVYTNFPGSGGMSLRATYALPFSAHVTDPFPLDGIEGTLMQIELTAGTQPLRVFRGSMRFREIGVYFNGEKAEFWSSNDLALLGIENVGLFREIEFDIDTGGALTLQVKTEIPGFDMGQRATATVNTETTTTGRRPENFRLPGNVRGALTSWKLSGDADCRLYGARVFCRALGSGALWQWLSLPIAPTSSEFSTVELPIPTTPIQPYWVDIPVDVIE